MSVLGLFRQHGLAAALATETPEKTIRIRSNLLKVLMNWL